MWRPSPPSTASGLILWWPKSVFTDTAALITLRALRVLSVAAKSARINMRASIVFNGEGELGWSTVLGADPAAIAGRASSALIAGLESLFASLSGGGLIAAP